jgi:hypothetical protein
MQKRYSSVLLITDNADMARLVRRLVANKGVHVKVAHGEDIDLHGRNKVIIADSSYADKIDHHASSVNLVLGCSESTEKYVDKFSKFIFNPNDEREINHALLPCLNCSKHYDVEHVVWQNGNTVLRFGADRFTFNGKDFYLQPAEEQWLFNWLVKGHKDGEKRNYLSNIRKRIGKDFLKGVKQNGREEK